METWGTRVVVDPTPHTQCQVVDVPLRPSSDYLKPTLNMLKMTSRVHFRPREIIFPNCAMSGRRLGREVGEDLSAYLTLRVSCPIGLTLGR